MDRDDVEQLARTRDRVDLREVLPGEVSKARQHLPVAAINRRSESAAVLAKPDPPLQRLTGKPSA